MSWFESLFGAVDIPARQEVAASYFDEVALGSPWADSSALERLTFESLYGLPSVDIPINRKTAMSIPAIAKGRNLIANTIARMPLVAEKNQRPLATQPSFLVQLQNGVPNFQTVSWIVDSLIFHGRSFLLIEERQANGQPKSLRFVPEWKAEVNDNGELVRAFDKPVLRGSYIRIDGPNEGLLNHSGELIRDVKELERVAAEVGANPVPSIVLKAVQNISPEEKSELLSGWSTNRRKRYGSVAYAGPNVNVEQIGQAAENLLIEGRNYATLQVGRALGIPGYFLDASVAGASLTYSNTSGKNRELIEAISPYMVSIEQTLSLYLPSGTVVEFDTSALLRGDTKERYETYTAAIAAGFLTVNEVRAMENLEPLDEPTPTTPPVPEEVTPNV